jgi:MFS family permease
LMVGFLGGGGVYPPLLVYVSRWFDRRRGTAIALISSGQYVAGVAWPALFERGISTVGWQLVMLGYAAVVLAVILPAVMFLRPPPTAPAPPRHAATIAADGRRRIAGLHPNVVQALLCVAAFFCCIPMSVPSAHLVAFCSDIGISPTRSAVMLSVMLAAAFLARQAWGALADRIGGLRTILAGSICQAVAISLFLTTQDEAGLFAISAAFGLGFAGIIPAYSVAIGGVLAHAADAVHGDEWHGVRKLVRRLPLRPLRLLRAGVRHWRGVQHRQPLHHRLPGVPHRRPEAPARVACGGLSDAVREPAEPGDLDRHAVAALQ